MKKSVKFHRAWGVYASGECASFSNERAARLIPKYAKPLGQGVKDTTKVPKPCPQCEDPDCSEDCEDAPDEEEAEDQVDLTPEEAAQESLSEMDWHELRALAKDLGIEGYTRMSREVLEPAVQEALNATG